MKTGTDYCDEPILFMTCSGPSGLPLQFTQIHTIKIVVKIPAKNRKDFVLLSKPKFFFIIVSLLKFKKKLNKFMMPIFLLEKVIPGL